MSVISRLRRNEAGTSLVVLAFSLVVLLGFAGIAVDAAGAWALRRQGQSGADTGAIAGAIFTTGRTKADAIADATDEVIRITYQTLDPAMTPAEWTAAWASCTDPNKPAVFTESGTSSCISFTDNLNSIRVTTPIIPWETTFAQVMGFDRIDTRATAEVHTELSSPGGVLPFAMPGAAAADGEVCLKSGANPKNITPCDGPDTGNFGFLDFTQFGDPLASIPAICNGGNDRLENNIARGIDHALGETSTFPVTTANLERDACDDGNSLAEPYQVTTETGNVSGALDEGFVAGTSGGFPGRLTLSSNVVDVRGHFIDNTPLAAYLNSNGASVCGSVATHDDMIDCLVNTYNPVTDGEIFVEGLGESARFGWVPLVHETSLGPGGTDVTIKDFRPVFIQTTLWKCNASGCDLEFDPGEPFGSGAMNAEVEAATAIAIPEAAMPLSIREVAPGNAGQIAHLLSK